MLPCMAISGGRILVHYATIQAERYLLSLVLTIIDGHPSQALSLMELVNHILSFILKQHIWRYDGYQSPWVLRSEPKPDTCLVTPALVYKGSHSSSNLKLWGLHLAMRPSLSRCLIQCSPMTVGGRVLSTTCLNRKPGEESKSSWVASSPSSRPRIWARTSLTSGRSFSYSSKRDFRRAASEGLVEAVVSASLASNSFHTLEGVAPSLELLVVALLPRFRSLRRILTLRP